MSQRSPLHGAVERLTAWFQGQPRVIRFGAVGLSGVVVNLGLLYILAEHVRLYDLIAVPLAVEASIVSNFLLNDVLTFRDRRSGHRMARLARFNAVSLVALIANLAVYAALTRLLGVHYLVAEATAILVAFGANYRGNVQWTYGGDARFKLRRLLRKGLPWIPMGLVVAAATWAYADDIDNVQTMYFDEGYYVSVAYQIKSGIWEDPCWEHSELDHRPLNYEHPPLAKLIIAWSVIEFGENDQVFEGCRDKESNDYEEFRSALYKDEDPMVWRAPSIVFGAMVVLFTGLAAGRLWGPLAGFLGSAFVALDGLVYTSGRMATLDIFATGFTMVAVFAATFPTRRGRIAAAVALGLGFACKYYVAFLGPALLLLSWYVHRRAGSRVGWGWLGRHAVMFAAVAIGIWTISYLPWFRIWVPQMGWIGAATHLGALTAEAFSWGASGQQTHAYTSPPGRWFMLDRPMLFFIDRQVDGDHSLGRFIYGIGNPLVWWAGALSVGAVWLRAAWLTLRPSGKKGDLSKWWRGLSDDGRALRIASTLPLAAYSGFFLLERSTFGFYMVFIVPLLACVLAGAAAVSLRRGGGAWVAPLVVAAFTVFMHFFPLLSGQVVPDEAVSRIMDIVPWMRP